RSDKECNDWQEFSGTLGASSEDDCSNVLRLETKVLTPSSDALVGACWVNLARELRQYRAYDESAQVYQAVLSDEFHLARRWLTPTDQREIDRRVEKAVSHEPLQKAFQQKKPNGTEEEFKKFVEEQKQAVREEISLDLAYQYLGPQDVKENNRYFTRSL